MVSQSLRLLVASGAAAALLIPAAPARASDGLVGGIVGGIVGGMIVNEAQRNRQQQRTTTTTVSRSRAEVAEAQTALNYFGFPAGSPDGVAGPRTRSAISSFQAFLGYPATGVLTPFEQQFLVTSYNRALAGGPMTAQAVAANPMGSRGLLVAYRDEMARGALPQTAVPQVQQQDAGQGGTLAFAGPQAGGAAAPAEQERAAGLPSFGARASGGATVSLASHCNAVSLATSGKGGFVTLATLRDPVEAINEQFCLARTYAIAEGDDLARSVSGMSSGDIQRQCEAVAPAMRAQIASVSLRPRDAVLGDLAVFVAGTGMDKAELAATGRICLGVGYRTDNMEIALASALILVAAGEEAYGELLGHHLSQGFGVGRRPDLATPWYQASFDAVEAGAPAAFVPGQPERVMLLRAATQAMSGGATGGGLPRLVPTGGKAN